MDSTQVLPTVVWIENAAGEEFTSLIGQDLDFSTDLIYDSPADPEPNASIEPELDQSTELDIELSTQPDVDQSTEPEIGLSTEPEISVLTEPEISVLTEPTLDNLSDPLSSSRGDSTSALYATSLLSRAQAASVGAIAKTGYNVIDALLSNYKWNGSTITYSFYDNQTSGTYTEPSFKVSEVTEAVKANVRYILETVIESVINVDFIEVADTSNNYGQLRYMFGPAGYAHAYFPDPNSDDVMGDVHLNEEDNKVASKSFEAGAGSYGFETLLHETLHTLGLKHPGNYDGDGQGVGPFLPYAQDNNSNTVMTYNSGGSSASTLMPYDIRALQSVYGARGLNAGNTVYTFQTVSGFSDGNRRWGSNNTPTKATIWDAGGLDTLDFSALADKNRGYLFDLQAGQMLTSMADYQSANYKPIDAGNSNTATQRTTASGTAIAYNVTIENVLASNSDDTVWGNTAANSVWGVKGNDWLMGDDSADQLLGGNGDDYLIGGSVRFNNRKMYTVVDNDNDQMTGGSGKDIFVVGFGAGVEQILDFQIGQDTIGLMDDIKFNQVRISGGQGNASISVGQDVLAVLRGVQAGQLSASDFTTV